MVQSVLRLAEFIFGIDKIFFVLAEQKFEFSVQNRKSKFVKISSRENVSPKGSVAQGEE